MKDHNETVSSSRYECDEFSDEFDSIPQDQDRQGHQQQSITGQAPNEITNITAPPAFGSASNNIQSDGETDQSLEISHVYEYLPGVILHLPEPIEPQAGNLSSGDTRLFNEGWAGILKNNPSGYAQQLPKTGAVAPVQSTSYASGSSPYATPSSKRPSSATPHSKDKVKRKKKLNVNEEQSKMPPYTIYDNKLRDAHTNLRSVVGGGSLHKIINKAAVTLKGNEELLRISRIMISELQGNPGLSPKIQQYIQEFMQKDKNPNKI